MRKFGRGLLVALVVMALVFGVMAMLLAHSHVWGLVAMGTGYAPLWSILGSVAAVCAVLMFIQRRKLKVPPRSFVLALLVMITLVPMAYADGGDAPAQWIDLTPIFQAIIGLLAMWITIKATPWIKARTTKQQQDLMLSTVRILVYAAEQIYGAGRGEQKLDYVQDMLKAKGFTVDIDAIEATVREMNLWVPLAGVEIRDASVT